MPQTTPAEYARAFVLNAVFFIAGIVAYIVGVSTHPLQVGLITAFSAFYLYRRMRMIRVEEASIPYDDETTFLTLVDNYLQLKDRWTLVEEHMNYRRYETRLFLGLYRFTAVLEIYPQVDHARLRGHYRALGGVLRELAHPQYTRALSRRSGHDPA